MFFLGSVASRIAARLPRLATGCPTSRAPVWVLYPNQRSDILPLMAKRLVDIDDALLERARSIAGTDTIKATVSAALQRLVDDEKVRRHIQRLRGSGALDLARLEAARRPRSAR